MTEVLVDLVKDSLLDFQNDLFDEYFLDQALQDLMIRNENEENNTNFLDILD